MPLADLIPLAAAAVAAAAAAYSARLGRRKLNAEADNLAVDSSSKLVDTVMRQLDRMETEIAQLRQTVAAYRDEMERAEVRERRLRDYIAELVAFIGRLGHEPPPDYTSDL